MDMAAMMISMMLGVMTMTMAMMSSSEREFPRQESACRRTFSHCLVSASEAAAKKYVIMLQEFFRSGRRYT